MKRREFLTVPAKALGGTLLYTLAREPMRLQAQDGNVSIPLRFFSAGEARVITAVAPAFSRPTPADPARPKLESSFTSTGSSPDPMAATNIDIRKGRSSNRFPNMDIRGRKRPAKFTAPRSDRWAGSRTRRWPRQN